MDELMIQTNLKIGFLFVKVKVFGAGDKMQSLNILLQ